MKGTTEDEIVDWHHRLDRHEFEQALGVDDGQGSPVCCSPWGCKESDTTQQLNNNKGRAANTGLSWLEHSIALDPQGTGFWPVIPQGQANGLLTMTPSLGHPLPPTAAAHSHFHENFPHSPSERQSGLPQCKCM